MTSDGKMIQEALDAARLFFCSEVIDGIGIEMLGRGHINDSFLLHIHGGGRSDKYVLQKINQRVFPEPGKIMANLRVLADHFDKYGVARKAGGLETIRPHPSLAGTEYVVDLEQNYWRVINFVEDTVGSEKIPRKRRAEEMGRALGLFHRITSNLDASLLMDPLPGFHVTPRYLASFDVLMENTPWPARTSSETYCIEAIADGRDYINVLEDAAKLGLIQHQVIHGDPKMDNILFDSQSNRAVALIDLDTVKPGLLHYDIGDCLRSACNAAGENVDVQENVFDLETCRDVLQEYFKEMGGLLTEYDIDYIYPAVRLITFELALRFFSDHISGDVYFRTTRSDQNLHRAMAQFALLESIVGIEFEIRGAISELWSQST